MPNKLIQVLKRLCFTLSIPLVSIIHIKLNTYRPNVHNIATKIDELTPVMPAFVIPYIYWFLFIAMILVYFAVVDYKNYFRLLMSIVAGMFTCFIVFYFFPTTVPRPELTGSDIFTRMLNELIYKNDNPYNCFPSIHVLNSVIVTLFFCRFNKNNILRAGAILSCVAISLSTLFIKQHYVADMVSAMLIATVMYAIFTYDSLWNSVPVKRVIDFLIPAKFKSFYID